MLTQRDYKMLMDLQSRIYSSKDDLRITVLQALQDAYKDYPMAFFLTDENSQYINPVSIHINNGMMKTYNDYYYKTDIFHTYSIPKGLLSKNIVHITDIMSQYEYENSIFYNNILSTMGVYDEIALQLHDNHKLLGVVGIMKPKSCGSFSLEELQKADILRDIISRRLKECLDSTKVEQENSLIVDSMEKAPIGIVVYDNKLTAIHFNQIAVQFIKELWGEDFSLDSINGLMTRLSEKMCFNASNSQSSLMTSIQNFYFKVVPFVTPNPNCGFNIFYSLYIIKNDNSYYIDHKVLQTVYNLTSRECDIVFMISQGYSNKRIAEELFISPHTVKTHIQNVFKKMDSNSRTEVLHKIIL
ncbi:MAG: helix-turn-helix transcriptional regulator [Youngiibacter sp.]|nr:helix-turn-helix transcriptional regulator [Youngiibacter sp.]